MEQYDVSNSADPMHEDIPAMDEVDAENEEMNEVEPEDIGLSDLDAESNDEQQETSCEAEETVPV